MWFRVLELDPSEIAQQLTVFQHYLFSRIKGTMDDVSGSANVDQLYNNVGGGMFVTFSHGDLGIEAKCVQDPWLPAPQAPP